MSVSVWIGEEGVKAYRSGTRWTNDGGFLTVWAGDNEIAEYAPGWRAAWLTEEEVLAPR